MKLNQPFRRPSLNSEERVAFNTPEPVKAEVSEPVIPPLVSNKPEMPSLVKTETSEPALPKLERVQKKQVELSPPQSAAEVEATAEPETSGGVPKLVKEEKPAVAWPFSTDEQKDLQEELQTERAKPAIPELQQPVAIPKLEITKGNGEVKKVDIPALDAYNKMEVVHLLIGRSSEDEEIVLLQSFSERFVRTKNKDEFNQSVYARISAHYQAMFSAHQYDLYERRAHHSIQVQTVTPQLANKGVEWVAALADDGLPAGSDIQAYANSEGISVDDALTEIRESGLFKIPPSFIYTWALVKVKIGHDFGSYRLSELMPTL